MPEHLSREAAAQYLREAHGLRCQPGLLTKLASVGGGPAYTKRGRFASYARPDLDAWAKERISRPVRQACELREQAAA